MPARVIPEAADEEAAATAAQVKLPWPTNYVGGLAYALAKELQLLNGAPETKLRHRVAPGDTAALVISTFGLPDAGVLLGAGHRIVYTETAPTAVVLDEYDPGWPKAHAIPRGTVLVLDTWSVKPDRYDWSRPEGAEE